MVRMILCLCSLSLLLALQAGAAAPSAAPSTLPATALRAHPRPRVVAAADPYRVVAVGLPAVASDGRTVAVAEQESSLSGSGSFTVRLLRVGDGSLVREIVISSVDNDGRELWVPSAHGRTAWARARFVNAELDRGGYRALVRLASHDGARSWRGGGLRASYDRRNGRFVVRGAAGAARGRLTRQQVSCGMELERPDEVIIRPAEILALYGDGATGVALLTYGLRYASCMCQDDVSHHIARLAPLTNAR
jgi:hypothetical protein